MQKGSLVSVKFNKSEMIDWNVPTSLYRKYIGKYAECIQDDCSCQSVIMWSVIPEFYHNKFGLVVESIAFQNDSKYSYDLESYYSMVLFGDFKVLIPNSRLVERTA